MRFNIDLWSDNQDGLLPLGRNLLFRWFIGVGGKFNLFIFLLIRFLLMLDVLSMFGGILNIFILKFNQFHWRPMVHEELFIRISLALGFQVSWFSCSFNPKPYGFIGTLDKFCDFVHFFKFLFPFLLLRKTWYFLGFHEILNVKKIQKIKENKSVAYEKKNKEMQNGKNKVVP